MNRSTCVLLGSASALGVTFADDAGAQQQSSAGQLQVVTVTAEKRTENLQTTPISITAVTGKDIEERGLTDFISLAQTVPGISMKSSGAGQTEFEMRGMTSSGGNSATVGFYLDDTPLSAPAAAQNGKVVIDPSLYDLNRVEVLRGPQGTLYGSGSMGGTIRLITNQPDTGAFDVSGKLSLSGTDGGGFNHGESAMVNLPFGGGTAAVRVVGSFEHDSGWISRIVIAPGQFPEETNFDPAIGNFITRGNVAAAPVAADYKGINNQDVTGARVSLVWKPTERLSITPAILYQKITQDGLSQIDNNPGTNTNYQPYDQAEPFVDRFDLYSLNVQYHFDSFDLTSATAYWTRDEELRQDGSEELQWVLGPALSPPPPTGPGCPFPLPFNTVPPCGLGPTTPTPLENDKSWQTTQELRLSSSGDSRFKWLLGYFYSDFESDWDLYVLQPGGEPLFGTGNGFTQVQPTKIIQNSFFGEASYQFAPQLTATVGLRRYSYNNEVNTTVSGFLSGAYNSPTASQNPGTPQAVNMSTSSEHNQGLNPKFGLSWQGDQNLLTYASATKGFRPGGANQPIPTSGPLGNSCEANLMQIYGTTAFVPAPDTFGPDSVWTYELGGKWRTNDARVSVNGAAYFSHWFDAQQFVPLPCGFNFSTNTGDAHVYGGELEVNALLAPGLQLSANGAYTHAEFVASTVLPGVIAANGLKVQDVPLYTTNVALTYRHPLRDGLDLTARIENTYVASRTEVTYALYTIPPYALTNLRLGVDGGRWTATLFASNVFNRVAQISNAYQINISIATFQRVTVVPPLTIGIEGTYHLGGR